MAPMENIKSLFDFNRALASLVNPQLCLDVGREVEFLPGQLI